MRIQQWTALVLIGLFACSSDGTGPTSGGPGPTLQYAVEIDRCENAPEPGVVHYTCTVLVTRENGTQPIVGAHIRFAATLGVVAPEYGETGSAGLGSVVWTVTAAELQGVNSGTLQACAMNISPPTCVPMAVHTQAF